jgi:hypothetical protein
MKLPVVDKETLDKEIKRAFQHYQKERLKLNDLCALTGISNGSLRHYVFKYYDGWAEACEANGGKCGPTGAENLKPNLGFSKELCLQEGRRVATMVAPRNLSLSLFRKYGEISTPVIFRLWGRKGWIKFVKELGLPLAEGYHETVSLEVLADDFLKAFDLERKKIPTLMRVVRLSKRGSRLYRKDGYPAFKKSAIEYLLKNRPLDEMTRKIFEDELVKIGGTLTTSHRPHEHGRMLGFRGFAYVPTYEHEVKGIFQAVAHDLDFEILCMREEFPDCEAQRRNPNSHRERFKRCVIEVELKSSDFRKHKHPIDQCDLIVCWEHDWKDCPLEVLELKKAIQPLSGWREN